MCWCGARDEARRRVGARRRRGFGGEYGFSVECGCVG